MQITITDRKVRIERGINHKHGRFSVYVSNNRFGFLLRDVIRQAVKPLGYVVRSRGRRLDKGKLVGEYWTWDGQQRQKLPQHFRVSVPIKYSQFIALYFDKRREIRT
jgi:hypothetical protein